eukprot:8471957-Pyramimonas_sp.AAC.1
MDWDAIEKEFMPAEKCVLISSATYKNQYVLGQCGRGDGLRREHGHAVAVHAVVPVEGPGCIPQIPAPQLEADVTALR